MMCVCVFASRLLERRELDEGFQCVGTCVRPMGASVDTKMFKCVCVRVHSF